MRFMFKVTERGGGGGGRPLQYILIDRQTMIPADTMTWAFWMERERPKPVGESLWRVAHTNLVGGIYVSTVFLGLDHSWSESGPPIVFETMAFLPITRAYQDKWARLGKGKKLTRIIRRGQRGLNEVIQLRYGTWAQAEAGHAEAVRVTRRYRLELLAAVRAGDKRAVTRLSNRMWDEISLVRG